MKYCILLFYISYKKKIYIIYDSPNDKFLASSLTTVKKNKRLDVEGMM